MIQFIKTVRTGNGEVAYLLDTERGVVIKAPIVDYMTPHAAELYEDENENKESAPYRPRRRAQALPATEEDIEDALGEALTATPPSAPAPRRPSIMPSTMRGIFVPPGNRGEDIEKRVV